MEVGMAQKVTVELEDDLDGGPADETVRFGFDGSDYEIDLSKKNAARFRSQLDPYIEHARKAGRGPRRRSARAPSSRQHSGAVRAWAREQGITVSERGRIPASVIDQYEIAVGGA
jgi:Lsr2